MKKSSNLYQYFQPAKYELSGEGAKVMGKKIGPPSRRLTFHQKGLKIKDARIIRMDKKGDQDFLVSRINHMPSFQQVRLHTQETLFPGNYTVILKFTPPKDLSADTDKRQLFPCIDEPEAWSIAEINKIT